MFSINLLHYFCLLPLRDEMSDDEDVCVNKTTTGQRSSL